MNNLLEGLTKEETKERGSKGHRRMGRTQNLILTLVFFAIAVSLNTFSVSQQIKLPNRDLGYQPTISLLGVPKEEERNGGEEKGILLGATNGEASSLPPRKIKVDDRPIRSWGCDLTETPLIFVHNGKSGGGAIRARLAAAAENVTRMKWQNANEDHHYFPIQDQFNTPGATPWAIGKQNETVNIRHGRFCNSEYPHYTFMPHIQKPLDHSTFEGRSWCNATTPLGMAVACHHPYRQHGGRPGGIRLWHYSNVNCKQCDDDYYLESDYYFFEGGYIYSGNIDSHLNISHINANLKNVDVINSNKTVAVPRRRLSEVAFNSNTKKETSSEGNKSSEKLGKKGKRDRRETRKQETSSDGNKSSEKRGRRGKRDRREKRTQRPPFSDSLLDPKHDPPPGSTCDSVFVAHLNVGSELTWLPPRYLKNHWWDQSEFGKMPEPKKLLEPFWDRLLDDRRHRRNKLKLAAMDHDEIGKANIEPEKESASGRWCPAGYKYEGKTLYDRPSTKKEFNAAYETCGRSVAADADRAFMEAFSSSSNFSPFYASMPVHRVTIMRDPWAWIVSKFFWHRLNKYVLKEKGVLPCMDVLRAVEKDDELPPVDPRNPTRQVGWVEQFSLLFLIKLCGDDCRIRYENGMMTLEEIEEQVSSNLRNAFSVVGILQDQDSFYDMLTDRIQYVDMGLHPNMTGQEHATPKTKLNRKCKALYAGNETFREIVREKVPAFAALERTYHLGIRVNAFQKEELRQCKLAKGEEPTRRTYSKV